MSRSPLTTCGGGVTLPELVTETIEIDGVMVTDGEMELTQTPANNSLLLFLNGVLLAEGLANDYILSGLTVIFPPGRIFDGDRITARYTGS